AMAKILAQEIFRLLHEDRHSLAKIFVCVTGTRAYAACKKNVLGYLDYIEYKLKSPFLTVDIIIEFKGGIVLIKRSNPPFGWAIPGGFVDYGESLEDAAQREAKEETNLDVAGLKQFNTYSDPRRDPRFHTVCTVFSAKGKGIPRAGDDAADIRIAYPRDLKKIDFAFDHGNVIKDYLKFRGHNT
ncbi:MAG: NUDIX hydrolase, partial [Candidatus Omnitrophota bacterium]